ncbi:hypothetical protein BDW74DRAFT_141918 [Aspergillus multicolor]|uniref:uncharacterized protein n=1 Tax=Aspergillus multicolor TaxID=41759 RepID=UPI003CCDCB68
MFRPRALVNLVDRVFATAPRATPLNPIPVRPPALLNLNRPTHHVLPPSLSDGQLDNHDQPPARMVPPPIPVMDGINFWLNKVEKESGRCKPKSVKFTQIQSARSGKDVKLKSILKPENRIRQPKVKLRPWVKRKGVHFEEETRGLIVDRWFDPLEHLHSANWDLETWARHYEAQQIAQIAKFEKAEAEKARPPLRSAMVRGKGTAQNAKFEKAEAGKAQPLRSAIAKGESTVRKCYDTVFKAKPTKRVQFAEYGTVVEFERYIDPEKDVHPERQFAKGKYLTAWKVKHHPGVTVEFIADQRIFSRKDSDYKTFWNTAPWGQMYRHMEPCRHGGMCSWNDIADLQKQNPHWYPADAMEAWLNIREKLRIDLRPF